MVLLLDWHYFPYVEYISHSTLALPVLCLTHRMNKIANSDSKKSVRHWENWKNQDSKQKHEKTQLLLYTHDY